MRRAMTVLELTFVIAIIGIVASIALPKLAASRDDAHAIKNIHNLTSCVNENLGYIVANNPFDSTSTSCKSASVCFDITFHESNATIDVSSRLNTGLEECPPTHKLATRQKLIGIHSVVTKSINL